jgi:hypothetical protein
MAQMPLARWPSNPMASLLLVAIAPPLEHFGPSVAMPYVKAQDSGQANSLTAMSDPAYPRENTHHLRPIKP